MPTDRVYALLQSRGEEGQGKRTAPEFATGRTSCWLGGYPDHCCLQVNVSSWALAKSGRTDGLVKEPAMARALI